VGLFTDIIVLLGSISAIGSYITPSYELSLANKMVKLMLLLLIFFTGLWGLGIGILVILVYLSTLKSFSKPYLYPLIPFNLKKLIRQVIRFPYTDRRYAGDKQSTTESN
jgi:stage V sporulation protein AF